MNPIRGVALALLTMSLSLGTFMMVLDYSIANVSVPYIAGDLGVSDNNGTWVITCFAAGNAIALPLTGFLSGRFGGVRIFIIATLLFTIMSWICGVAFTFPMLLISRFLQGFVAGPLIPLSQSLLLVYYPPARRKIALAIWGAVVIIGPILGPIIGGYLTYNYSWHWIFYINVPVGILSAWMTWHIIGGTDSGMSYKKLDLVGLFFLAVGVTCLQVLVDNGQQYDWFRSNLIWTLAICSFLGFTLLLIWQLTSKNPLINFRLFANRNFAVGTFVTSISFMFIFGNMVLMPLWLQDFMGYTAETAGLAMAPMGLMPLIGMPIAVKLMERSSLRVICGACFTLFFIAFLAYSFFTTQVGFEYVAISRFWVGAPFALYMAPLTAITLSRIVPEDLSMASGIFHFFRVFFGGLGTSLLVTLWERRTIFHRFNLVETLTHFNPLARGTLAELQHAGLSQKASLEMLDALTTQQASVLGMNDVFWTTAWIFVPLTLLCVLFLRRPHLDKPLSMDQMVGGH